MNKMLSIVVPVYNEKNFVIDVLKKLRTLKINNIDIELLVVDDCSNDGTREMLKTQCEEFVDKIIYHEVNMGKGAALRTGFKEVTGDVVIIQDCDLEYDIFEIESVVMPIFNGDADVVYGSRFLNGKYKGYKINQIANRILTYLSNKITGFKLTDMETCYKAFSVDFIKKVEIKENGFGFEPEITAKVAKNKLKLIEVPISYYPRTKKEGKKITLKDGIQTLYCIFKYKKGE